MKTLSVFIFLILFILINFNYLQAESQNNNQLLVNELVVMGELEDQELSIDKAPEVFASESLKDQLTKTNVDIISSGGASGQTSLFYRGMPPEHSAILLDGIPLNDPSGASGSADLSIINFIQPTEIRMTSPSPSTPSSKVYSAGSTVNIETSPRGRNSLYFVQSEIHDPLSWRIKGGVHPKWDNGSFNLRLAINESLEDYAADPKDGNSEKDPSKNYYASAGGEVTLDDCCFWLSHLHYIQNEGNLDLHGGTNGDDPNYTAKSHLWQGKTQLEGSFLDDIWNQKLILSHMHSQRKYQNLTDRVHPLDTIDEKYIGKRTILSWHHLLELEKYQQISMGTNRIWETALIDSESNSKWGPYSQYLEKKAIPSQELFLLYESLWQKHWLLNAGQELKLPKQRAESWDFQVLGGYRFNKRGQEIYLSYRTLTKFPSLSQLYGQMGNELLKDEKSRITELVYLHPLQTPDSFIKASLFHSSYRHLIQFDPQKGIANIGESYSQGVELQAQSSFSERWIFNLITTYLNTLDKKSDLPLLRRPNWLLSSHLSYHQQNWGKWTIDFIYRGEREDISDNPQDSYQRMTLKPYNLWHLGFKKVFFKKLTLLFQIKNLLNTHYQEVYGYDAKDRSFSLTLSSKGIRKG